MESLVHITLKRGVIGSPEAHKRTVKALGLMHRHQTRSLKVTPQVQGMIRQVSHLVSSCTEPPLKDSQQLLYLLPEFELGAVKAKPTPSTSKPKSVQKKLEAVETASAAVKTSSSQGPSQKKPSPKKVQVKTKAKTKTAKTTAKKKK